MKSSQILLLVVFFIIASGGGVAQDIGLTKKAKRNNVSLNYMFLGYTNKNLHSSVLHSWYQNMVQLEYTFNFNRLFSLGAYTRVNMVHHPAEDYRAEVDLAFGGIGYMHLLPMFDVDYRIPWDIYMVGMYGSGIGIDYEYYGTDSKMIEWAYGLGVGYRFKPLVGVFFDVLYGRFFNGCEDMLYTWDEYDNRHRNFDKWKVRLGVNVSF